MERWPGLSEVPTIETSELMATSKRKLLHVASVFPANSNRLALQCDYARDSWSIALLHLAASHQHFATNSRWVDEVHTLPQKPSHRPNDNYLLRRIRSLIRRVVNSLALCVTLMRSDAEVMHAHENSSLWTLALWVIVFRRPAVWDPHDYFHGRLRLRSRFGRMNRKEFLERLVVRRKTPILVVSNGMYEKFVEMYPNARIEIVKNYSASQKYVGVDASPVAETADKLVTGRNRLATGKLRLVYPGLIKPERIQPSLIGALAGIPNVELDIYGIDRSKNYQARMEKFLLHEKIENVRFKGIYRSDSLISILMDYHFALFPFPVTYENLDFCLPNKFFQCIEAGLPMITTNMKEMGGIITHFRLGYVFPSDDDSACAEILSNCSVTGDDYRSLVRNVLNYQAAEVNYAQQQSTLLDTYAAALERR